MTVIGDANRRIGKETMYMPTIEIYSKHNTIKENGHFVIDFAKEKGMIIKNTYFWRKRH